MIKLKIKYGNSQTDLRFPCTEKEMNVYQYPCDMGNTRDV